VNTWVDFVAWFALCFCMGGLGFIVGRVSERMRKDDDP